MDKVLIVDQVIPIIKRIKKACRNLNLFFFEASTEYEAVNIYQENRDEISLIILDIAMNNFDGYRILSRIRKMDQKVNIIVLTSLNTRRDFVSCLKIGIDDYILKPFDNEFMRERIMRILPTMQLEEDIVSQGILRDYFNKYYSLTLENNTKLFVLLGAFYSYSDDGGNYLLENNRISRESVKKLEGALFEKSLFLNYKKQSFIAIVPDIELNAMKTLKDNISKTLKNNNIDFIYQSRLLPSLNHELISFNALVKNLEEKLLKEIKYNLSNVNNIEDF